MINKFTFWLTLFSLFVCLVNNAGYDRENLLLFFTSIPAWILEIFTDVNRVNALVVYILTIGSWTLLGYVLDRAIERRRNVQNT